MERCPWVGEAEIYQSYHDLEWGVPVTDGRSLWEKLILDGFQAGLSWLTILRKREAFVDAFDGFEPERIANWGSAEVDRLLQNPGIVRHRGKIEATIANARGFLEIEGQVGFAKFLWREVGGRPVQTNPVRQADVPTQNDVSGRLSKDLKARGWKFVGPTIIYAFMEATGFYNNHLVSCHRHGVVQTMGEAMDPVV